MQAIIFILFLFFVLFSFYEIGWHTFIFSYLLSILVCLPIGKLPVSNIIKLVIAVAYSSIGFWIYNSHFMGVSKLIDAHHVLRNIQRRGTNTDYWLSVFNPLDYGDFFQQALVLSYILVPFLVINRMKVEKPGEYLFNQLKNNQAYFKSKHFKKCNQASAETLNGTNLGINSAKKMVSLSDNSANMHTLVLGTTGSGKTVSLLNIVESAINRNMPIVFIDGKGDDALGEKIIKFAQSQSRKTYFFSKTSNACFYNPLHTGTFTSKKDRIIGIREWSEPYYKRRAEEYVQNVFKILDKCGVKPDLFQAVEYMKPMALGNLIRKTDLKKADKDKLSVMLSKIQELEKDADGAVSELRLFVHSDIGESFETEGKNKNDILLLEKALEENAIVYFSLPSLEGKEASSMLGKLIINDLKAVINARKNKHRDSKKFFAIFDEFSVFAGEQILNILNMGRSGGVCGVVSTQTTADLADATLKGGQSFVSRVISNCNNYIIHRLNDSDVAEQMANVIGTYDTLEVTGKIVKNDFGDEGSLRAVKEYRVHPDVIKELGKGNAIFFSKDPYKLENIIVRHSFIDREK